jgi:hypothetical protein
MKTDVIAGVSIILFTYTLFAWALGAYINKKKEDNKNHWKNLWDGAWRLFFILGGLIVFGYFMGK